MGKKSFTDLNTSKKDQKRWTQQFFKTQKNLVGYGEDIFTIRKSFHIWGLWQKTCEERDLERWQYSTVLSARL